MQKSDNCISKTQCTKFSFQILKQTIVSCKSFCCISHLWNYWMQPFSSTPFLHSLTPIHSCKLFSLQCLFGYPDWHSFPPSHRQCIPDIIYYLHLKKKMLPIFPESSVHFLKPQPLCPGTINEWVQLIILSQCIMSLYTPIISLIDLLGSEGNKPRFSEWCPYSIIQYPYEGGQGRGWDMFARRKYTNKWVYLEDQGPVIQICVKCSLRIVNHWNSLPLMMVEARSIETFKVGV